MVNLTYILRVGNTLNGSQNQVALRFCSLFLWEVWRRERVLLCGVIGEASWGSEIQARFRKTDRTFDRSLRRSFSKPGNSASKGIEKNPIMHGMFGEELMVQCHQKKGLVQRCVISESRKLEVGNFGWHAMGCGIFSHRLQGVFCRSLSYVKDFLMTWKDQVVLKTQYILFFSETELYCKSREKG